MSRAGLSIIIADDHPLMRAGLKAALASDHRFNLVAFAQTGAQTIEAIRRFRPDAAIVDFKIADPGAEEILQELAHGHQTQICFLMDDEPAELLEVEEKNRVVFVSERSPEHLRIWLHKIAANHRSIALRAQPNRLARRLTRRQNQIVAMLKVGSSNKQIADWLGLSEGTVKVHLHRIYRKVGVSNRTQLAAQSFARK